MWTATVRGVLARKVRLALTALAVVLGVSFVAGTYVLTDTLDRSFTNVFDQTLSRVDLVVRLRAPFGGEIERDRFPQATLDGVRGVTGVRSASGFLQDYAQFVDKAGDSIQTAGAPTLGISWAQRGRDGPLRVITDGKGRGRPPRGPDEVAMDLGTARAHGFRVGDRVRVLLDGPAQEFTIVGLFGFGDRTDAGPVTFAAFDLATAQQAFDAPGLLDAVNVRATPGTDLAQLRERLTTRLGPAYEVDTARDIARDRGKDVLNFLDVLTDLLLGFSTLGLVVGAFIIFNTFTILVTQRTRELALLRAVGASGRQVVASVLIEAATVGAIASAVGLALGLGLATGLLAAVDAAGFDVPEGPIVLEPRTVLAALAVGVAVTVLASVWPAIRASRVPPIAAIDDVAPAPGSGSSRARVIGGLLLLASGAFLLALGVDRTRHAPNVSDEIWVVALGALWLFFGVVLLLSRFARALADVFGRPLRAVGIVGVLARGNAMRNPRRTAATASALVVGLALVGLVAVFGDSVKASIRRAVDHGIRADFVLKAEHFATFSPQVAQRLRGRPGIGAVAAFRFGNVRVNAKEETVTGVDPTQLAAVVDLGLQRGSIGAMGDDGVLLSRDAAREYGVAPGDRLQIQFPRGFAVVRVGGVYGREDFVGGFPVPFVISKQAYDTGFGTDEQDGLVYVASTGDRSAARLAIHQALGRDFPNIQVLSRSQYRDNQERAVDRFLAVTAAVLLLSEIIAVLGIVNALALSVYERLRELALLRTAGMSRRQMRRMVRGESVIIAVIGGVVGTIVGLVWGWAFTTALRSQGVTELSVPGVQVGAFIAVAMVAGVVAAIAPAWRASRLPVLVGIAAE